jgi:hypothetical protein
MLDRTNCKSPQQISRELRTAFDAGLRWDEAAERIIPKLHSMRSAFRYDWFGWVAETRRMRGGNQ